MLAKDVNDCSECPLLDELCSGGMTSTPGGQPIEPPCVNWDPEEELEDIVNGIESSQLAYEEEIDRKYKEEQKAEKKKEIRNKRAKESRDYTRPETQKINKLYKRIETNNGLQRLARAFSMTNNMMNIKDKQPDKLKAVLEIENDKFRIEIEKLEKIKKIKLKELRNLRKEVEDETHND